MNINEMNVTELKALAFDLITQIEQTRNSLILVQQEIAKKQPTEQQPLQS